MGPLENLEMTENKWVIGVITEGKPKTNPAIFMGSLYDTNPHNAPI